MELLVVLVLGLLGIAGATAIGPRLGVSAPLLLVVVGVLVSFLPFVPDVVVDPEWILAGVLPPLLYSASVAMPSMEFRREFSAISGFSIVLVVISSLVLGVVFSLVVPGLGLAGGIALGAIVSPTDAVATSIVKRVGVTPRIVTVLEGESLLNDATALVLLRSAIAAGAASVSFWSVAGDFAWAVAVAVVLGYVVGKANLWLRARVTDATVNTVISLTVPFLASLPAEALGGSGLVAAVVAGLVTGRGAIRSLSPQHRVSDVQTWRTVELVLEGAVFLVMGLEMSAILDDLSNEAYGVHHGVLLALLALAAVLVVRAAYVFPTLAWFARRSRRAAALKPRLAAMQDRLESKDLEQLTRQIAERVAGRPPGGRGGRGGPRARGGPGAPGRGARAPSVERVARFRTRVRRKVADLDYFLAVPLGWREGTVIVWAGMRGAVTLAAAQTLPAETPARSLLVLAAFFVAAISLILQGGTLPWLVRLVKPATIDPAAIEQERAAIRGLLREVDERVRADRAGDVDGGGPADGGDGRKPHELWLEIISAQREALLAARDDGLYSSAMLAEALDRLDADQIRVELRAEGDAGAAA
ncbi:sodium:proton antiporter [Agromyces sp. CFH 90414]|uniref:Sodium:proton antiporter n=1 Tax=Agromyces agglutinans TaxID=2662258 RepID=A0A6I2F9D3_9MICO|nr:sodium:proton antiporter [Agromyces agglutinans]